MRRTLRFVSDDICTLIWNLKCCCALKPLYVFSDIAAHNCGNVIPLLHVSCITHVVVPVNMGEHYEMLIICNLCAHVCRCSCHFMTQTVTTGSFLQLIWDIIVISCTTRRLPQLMPIERYSWTARLALPSSFISRGMFMKCALICFWSMSLLQKVAEDYPLCVGPQLSNPCNGILGMLCVPNRTSKSSSNSFDPNVVPTLCIHDICFPHALRVCSGYGCGVYVRTFMDVLLSIVDGKIAHFPDA